MYMSSTTHIHTFTPPAPTLTSSHPPLGTVHQASGHTLTLEVNVSAIGVTEAQFRQNGAILTTYTDLQTGAGTGYFWVKLVVGEFAAERHGGEYELMVVSPAGTTLVASWTVKQAGIYSQNM